eukprot:CAMPEP_0201516122 /NCGR_PEP_ID=MMETSP0161_2-20130828/7523_1 /ASSEMBLY_ACC=CAM_ASM_000251 /TAXON_ID=180227 /ORGANISM="Neoparamoeba aestuarina, Strain SoJaBio B1-5/56/2" /LENGTH=336 /DNA_ID=CAMNT_0047913141 /DNA_START=43 /DNA_END=1050 /DNA_ORIENTATION=-
MMGLNGFSQVARGAFQQIRSVGLSQTFPQVGRTYTFQTVARNGKQSLLSNSLAPSALRGSGFSLTQRFYNRPTQYNQLAPQTTGATKYLKYGAMGAGAGLVINMASGMMSAPTADAYRQVARQRIATTYSYLFGSCAVTAGLATMMYRNGMAAYLMGMNQWVYLGVSMAAMYGSLIFTQSTPYENTIPKHLGLLGLNASMAASLSGLGFFGGPLVLKAAALTGAVVGSLSLAGAAAPSESWMTLHGPLSIGLGVVFGASIGQLFFPSTLLMNVAMYGGAAVFGGFVFYDTAKIRYSAQVSQRYDPVNNSLGIYITTINLFRIISSMLINQKKSEEK